VASETFVLNEIERTERIEDLHLARFGQRYVLNCWGAPANPKHSERCECRSNIVNSNNR